MIDVREHSRAEFSPRLAEGFWFLSPRVFSSSPPKAPSRPRRAQDPGEKKSKYFFLVASLPPPLIAGARALEMGFLSFDPAEGDYRRYCWACCRYPGRWQPPTGIVGGRGEHLGCATDVVVTLLLSPRAVSKGEAEMLTEAAAPLPVAAMVDSVATLYW